MLLASAISSPADRVYSSWVGWGDTGGWLRWEGSTYALSEGLSLSCQSPQLLKDNKFPPPAPLTSLFTAGFQTANMSYTDNHKVLNFKKPGHCIFSCCRLVLLELSGADRLVLRVDCLNNLLLSWSWDVTANNCFCSTNSSLCVSL